MSPAVESALRAQYNLDKPFWVQYALYLKSLVTFDLGTTFSGQEVRDVLARAFPVTARLAVMALAIESVFGIIFGVIAGMRKGKIFDSTVLIASLIVIAVPTFVLGFVLQYVVGVQLQWAKPTVSGGARWDELILPAVVLGLVSFAYVLRLTRTSIIENKQADYVRTATAKGLSRNRVITVHILRNSLIPVVTYLAPTSVPDGRRDRHRGHLQRARGGPPALPGDPEGRNAHRGGRGRGAGDRVRARQPDR